jgi:2-dehydropantoate 2-reductase
MHFLVRGDYEVVKEKGWRVRSCAGDFEVAPGKMRVYREAREMPGVDLVIVALKTTSEGSYRELIGPLVREGTAILSIQNGLGSDEKLAELFGAERVLGGLAFVCINRIGPGEIHHSAHGIIRMGEFGRRGGERAEGIARMFRESGVPCEVLPDLKKGRWEKLMWNIPFNGLGAVMDLTTDRLIGSAAGREMVGRLIAEAMAAGEGDGVLFDLTVEGMVEKQIRATESMGAYRSSMLVDRQEGRAMEVEAILGEPWRRGVRAGAGVGLLGQVYAMAKVVEGERNAKG